ncbi:ABC transporter ATPase [Burkholderia glumae BGR1]|nr:ABC transporter ATPase [Burkholderia glumae BGR1]
MPAAAREAGADAAIDGDSWQKMAVMAVLGTPWQPATPCMRRAARVARKNGAWRALDAGNDACSLSAHRDGGNRRHGRPRALHSRRCTPKRGARCHGARPRPARPESGASRPRLPASSRTPRRFLRSACIPLVSTSVSMQADLQRIRSCPPTRDSPAEYPALQRGPECYISTALSAHALRAFRPT